MTTTKWIEWWQSLPATERFPLMRKYEVKQVTDKLIKKMWLGEVVNDENQTNQTNNSPE